MPLAAAVRASRLMIDLSLGLPQIHRHRPRGGRSM